MPHSSELTSSCLNSPDPEARELEIWMKTRYLVAQKPTSEHSSVTNDMYYNGRAVLPGPLADISLTGHLVGKENLNVLKAKHSIQFVDFDTTAGADASVVEAHYGIMSKAEADDYERQLRAINVKQHL